MKNLNEKIKAWYTRTYPHDPIGYELNNETNFWDILDALENGIDIYKMMGTGDSDVRERILEKLSGLMDVDYDVIYEMWLAA